MPSLIRPGIASLLCGLLAACAALPESIPVRAPSSANRVVPFSQAETGIFLPAGWKPWILSRFNRMTDYRIVEDGGAHVLEASADSSASGVLQDVTVDAAVQPILSWRWRVSQISLSANLALRGSDDSPARVMVSFDGDRRKFDFEDRAMADLVKLFSGREMPFATLMYVWDPRLPVGTFLENAHSGRAMMIVVESGEDHVGQWLSFSRNLVEDYRRAFGEMPGPIVSVGVMTDSNATHSRITARYGDIALSPPTGKTLLLPVSVDVAGAAR